MAGWRAHDVGGRNDRLCFVGDWTLFHTSARPSFMVPLIYLVWLCCCELVGIVGP